jgi:hypothetical protein
MSRFPVAFRPPAFASRSSDSRRGIGLSLRSAYRAKPSARTSTGLPRSARTSCDRGGCPLYPEDDGAHPAGSPPRPAPAASQRQVLRSRQQQAIDGVPFTRHQTRVHAIHPSGLPLTHTPGMEPAALRLPPELRTLPSPATHVEGGDRPSSTDLELPLNSHPSISNPVVHSMRATSRRTANTRARERTRPRPALVAARWFVPSYVRAPFRYPSEHQSHATVATIAALALVMTGRFPASGIGRAVNGHRFLPAGGHEIPRWWPSFLPTGAHQISPWVAIKSPLRGLAGGQVIGVTPLKGERDDLGNCGLVRTASSGHARWRDTMELAVGRARRRRLRLPPATMPIPMSGRTSRRPDPGQAGSWLSLRICLSKMVVGA